MQPLMDYATLFTLAEKTTAIAQPCTCTAKALLGWEGWPVTLREAQLRQIGTLVQFEEEEATLDEYHPQGTSYWSVEAPIAPLYHPYNQCGVWECVACGRGYLRYNDDGAYHSESRIRILTASLIVDAGHPQQGRYPRAKTEACSG